jgi:hypothetical protein
MIRVPSRFSIVALLGVGILAGIGFERAIASLGATTQRRVTVLAALVLVAEYFAAPLNVVAYSVEIPVVDRWLATQPTPFAIAEIPLARPNDIVAWQERQSLFMIHSTAHWQPTVHGYSGLQPAFDDVLFSELTRFPDSAIVDRLAALGVDYVVVHPDLFRPGEWPLMQNRLAHCSDRLTLVHSDPSGIILRLPSTASPSDTHPGARSSAW